MNPFPCVVLTAAAFAVARPADAENRPPNILFCIADDASYPHMSVYGCPWVHTPAFDRVAKEGILFTHAYTPNAKCAPSRACILTGRNSWQLKEAANHVPFFPPEFKVFTEVLAEHGYFVGKTNKGWAPGIALDAQGEPRSLTGRSFDRRKTPPPTTGISPNDYAANFQDFLDAAPAGSPWFFWYGSAEPHREYEQGTGVRVGGRRLDQIDRVPGCWPDNETVRNDMLDYALEIEHFDRHLGRMLDLLAQRGQLENTLVVVTSDNGMPFPRAKGQQYETSSHMPLAVMWKRGVKSLGRAVDDYVSFIDFAPTFLELAGLNWAETGMASSPGRSLTDILTSDKAGQVNPQRDHVLIGQERHDVGRPNDVGYPIRGIVRSQMLYLQNFAPDRWPVGNPETGYLNTDASPTKSLILQARREGSAVAHWNLCFGKRPPEEMYSLADDPDCLRNLADRPEHAARKATLRDQLVAELKAQDDPRMSGRGAVFDEYPYADERVRHFYERYMRGEKIKAGWVNESDFEAGPLEK
jgi:N-sulfoglucosamine sulfohydrolase